MSLARISWIPHAVVIALFLVMWIGFDFNGLYGQDAHEYLRYSKALKESFETGISAGDFYWPKLFPFVGTLLSYVGISANTSLLLVSLASMLGSLYFLKRILRELYGTDGTIFVLVASATQVYFVRMGLLVMSDALATFWIAGFLLYYVKFRKSRMLKYAMFILIFAVLAVFTRYASLVLLAIPLLHVLWMFLSKWKLAVRLLIGLILIGGGVGLLLANNQLLHLSAQMFDSWDVVHLFQRNFVYESFPQSYWVPNGIYIWSNFAHFGFLSIGVLLFIWWKRWNFHLNWIWFGLLAYLIFLGGIGFQNQRFFVISHLWVLVLIYPAFEALRDWLLDRRLWTVFLGGVLVFNVAFFSYSFSKLFAMHRLEKEVSIAVKDLNDAPTIYAFYITPSLKSYDVPNKTVDLWTPNIDFEKGGYVVFNLEQFGTTRRVMRNWEKLNSEFDLEIIDELPENWKIYRIQ